LTLGRVIDRLGAMVVLLNPVLYGVLHHEGTPIATLRVEKHSWWNFGATCVSSVVSLIHKHLEGRWYTSLKEAVAVVSYELLNLQCTSTEYMETVLLYLRGAEPIPSIITTAALGCKISGPFDALAHAHVDTRVESFPDDVGGGCWLCIGKAMPIIPPDMSREAMLNPRVWASYTPSARLGVDAVAAGAARAL
jgi:hypothetical protein